jgi:hypothetical protein
MTQWAAKGATFVLALDDTALMRQGATDALQAMRRGLKALPRSSPKRR